MLQPAARLGGRLRHGLSPWRRRSAPRLALPCPRTHAASGASAGARRTSALRDVETALRRSGGVVICGGDFERWDLHVRGGMLGSMRMRMAVEEHGAGRQLMRFRSWPRFSRIGLGVALGVRRARRLGARSTASWVVAAVLGRRALAARGLDGAGLRHGRRRPDASRSTSTRPSTRSASRAASRRARARSRAAARGTPPADGARGRRTA